MTILDFYMSLDHLRIDHCIGDLTLLQGRQNTSSLARFVTYGLFNIQKISRLNQVNEKYNCTCSCNLYFSKSDDGTLRISLWELSGDSISDHSIFVPVIVHVSLIRECALIFKKNISPFHNCDMERNSIHKYTNLPVEERAARYSYSHSNTCGAHCVMVLKAD